VIEGNDFKRIEAVADSVPGSLGPDDPATDVERISDRQGGHDDEKASLSKGSEDRIRLNLPG
jgi:hypothetical protein